MRVGIFAGVFAGMCWGTIFLMPALLHDFSPLTIVCVRYTLSGVVSLLLILPVGRRVLAKMTLKRFLVLVKLVLTGNIFYYLFATQAVQLIGVAPSALLLGLVPVTAVLFAGGDRSVPTKTLIAPLILILAGMLCLNTDVFIELAGVSISQKVLGIVCAILALALWSWYAISNAKYLKLNQDFTSNEWTLLYGVVTGITMLVIMVILQIFSIEIIPGGVAPERLHILLIAGFFMAVVPSLLGNFAWNVASRRLPISLTGQMIVFETIFALLYGFIYAGRFPRLLEMAAVVLLISGVIWAARKHR